MAITLRRSLAIGVGAFCLGYAIANTPALHRGESGLGSCSTAEDVLAHEFKSLSPSSCPLKGRVAIVTGANSGIGFETAKALALYGAQVILPCRTMAKAEDSAKRIQEYCRTKGVECLPCLTMTLDLNDLNTVRKFVSEFEQLDLPLHMLINNAGIMALPSREETVQGFEKQMGVNHLGHFLLTTLLVPILRKSAPSRVVCLTSMGHRLGTSEFLQKETLERSKYDQWGAYGDSKLANLLFAKEFNERYREDGITAYSVHPGGIHTNLQGHVGWRTALFWAFVTPFFFKSQPQGAATSVFCATHHAAVPYSGEYFDNCNVGVTSDPDQLIGKQNMRATLWSTSEALILKAEERENETSEN